MTIVRWTRSDLDSRIPGLLADQLDDVTVLVLEDVSASDDDGLRRWCRRAPCVVVGCAPAGRPPSTVVDVAVSQGDAVLLDRVLAGAERSPVASRLLVDVLRVVPALDILSGLAVESLAYSTLLASAEFSRWLASEPARSPKTFAADPVRSRRDGSDLVISLQRPENRNAFGSEMRDGLVSALAAAEVDPSIERVVINADGPVFSSGGDLAEFGSADDVARAHEIRTLRSVGAAIHALACTVHVRIRGACVGAGVELSAFADHLVGEPGTTLRLPEIGMGLIPGAGGTVSLSQRIGPQRVAELALSGRAMDVDEALRIGLLDEISPTTEAALRP